MDARPGHAEASIPNPPSVTCLAGAVDSRTPGPIFGTTTVLESVVAYMVTDSHGRTEPYRCPECKSEIELVVFGTPHHSGVNCLDCRTPMDHID